MNCRICDSINLEPVINLGMQPWCNNFLKKEDCGKEPFYPLKVIFCNNCKVSQLDYTVKKEIMFGDHTYLSGVTQSLSHHFKIVADDVDTAFFKNIKNKAVLDIGSNDGTQLKHFQRLNYDVVGIESSKRTAEIANKKGVPTINKFFNEKTAIELNKKFDVINAAGVFFHLEELHSVVRGIKKTLKNDGIFIVQFLYMKSIMENLAFDQIYHEHLLYYNLNTIEILFEKHNLFMFDAKLSNIHGGSIIAYVGHKGKRNISSRLKNMKQKEIDDQSNEIETYNVFSDRIKKMRQDNLAYLNQAKSSGKTIYGMGAPVKGNTMLNYFGIGTKYIDFLIEKNNLREGLYSPGQYIPIIMESNIEKQPDIYYVLAWNFKKEILKNNQKLITQGVNFYFPVNPKLN